MDVISKNAPPQFSSDAFVLFIYLAMYFTDALFALKSSKHF